jgi:hypothetical protein
MAKLLKKLSMVFLLVICALSFVACDKPVDQPEEPEIPGSDLEDVITPEYLTLDDYKAYVKHDFESAYKSINLTDNALKEAVKAKYDAGVKAIDEAKNYSQVKNAANYYKNKMAEAIPLADGVYSYSQLSTAEKTEILGLLEAYAVRNGITGISLFENGGYAMYNPRITFGTEIYFPGYGLGIMAEV